MRLLLLKQVESVEFTVWDIGGPASMATVNQCFFTDKALYVVVWNLALGEEAVASLQFWLLNIEVRRRQTLRSRAAEPHRGPTTSPKHPPLWVGGDGRGETLGIMAGVRRAPIHRSRGALKTLLGQMVVRALVVFFYLKFKSPPPTLDPKGRQSPPFHRLRW